MLTTLVASSKGGCGKTTLVTQLATHWAQSGKQTAIIDADRQQSSLRWTARRPENVPAVTAVEGSRKAFDRLPETIQRVIVDTPAGVTEKDLEPYLDKADVILVPVLPSHFDLDATLDFLAVLRAIPRVKRGKLPVGLVGNRLKPWTNASQAAIAELGERAPFPVVAELRARRRTSCSRRSVRASSITTRKTYADTRTTGESCCAGSSGAPEPTGTRHDLPHTWPSGGRYPCTNSSCCAMPRRSPAPTARTTASEN